jgi:hypothetical protein
MRVKLLKTPGFHHAVRSVHKRVHQLRNGVPPEEMGGTKIDSMSQVQVLGSWSLF